MIPFHLGSRVDLSCSSCFNLLFDTDFFYCIFSSADDGVDAKELQFQLNKLLEEKKNFLSQITEADESISLLRSENSYLKTELKKYFRFLRKILFNLGKVI